MEEKLTNEVELCAVNKIKGSYSTYFDYGDTDFHSREQLVS